MQLRALLPLSLLALSATALAKPLTVCTDASPEVRAANYAHAQQIIKEQALWLPLAHPTAAVITSNKVSSYQVSPFGRVDFSKVVLK